MLLFKRQFGFVPAAMIAGADRKEGPIVRVVGQNGELDVEIGQATTEFVDMCWECHC